ncbi:MAG: hypothetical protein JSV49_04125 [Thermoplasmata archaeon]|nr:MAG: hypothetical protein JSV49_04125 [Thermoplasmata archaeon]
MFLSISQVSNIEAENEIRLRGLRTVVDHLKGMKLGLQILEDLSVDALAQTRMLWILWPDRWFMPPEIEAVKKRLEGGMSLLVTSEWSGIENNAEILNSLVSDMGIKFNKDRIIDPINAYTKEELQGKSEKGAVSDKVVEFIKIKDFSNHPVVKGIVELAYYSGCSVTAAPNYTLAKSKFVSFSDVDGDKKWSEGEQIGSATTAAYAEYGNGRVIALGDTSLFTDKYIKFGDNKKFFVNVFNWLLRV